MWLYSVLLQQGQDGVPALRKLAVEPRDAILTPHDTRRSRFHEAPANLKGQTFRTPTTTCQAEETEAPGVGAGEKIPRVSGRDISGLWSSRRDSSSPGWVKL